MRGRLLGEISVSPVGRAEILLPLHDKFQIYRLYFTEVFSPSQPSCFLENNLSANAHVAFSALADVPFRLIHGIFADFSALLPGLKVLARFQKPG